MSKPFQKILEGLWCISLATVVGKSNAIYLLLKKPSYCYTIVLIVSNTICVFIVPKVDVAIEDDVIILIAEEDE